MKVSYCANVSQEGSNWLINFPDCKGCQTFGASYREAMEMAKEALTGWCEVHLLAGDALPRPLYNQGISISIEIEDEFLQEIKKQNWENANLYPLSIWEFLICLLLPIAGLVVGLGCLILNKPRASKILLLSSVSWFGWWLIWTIIKMF